MSVDRTEYIRGLRQLAEVLEQSDIPVPTDGSGSHMPITWHCLSKNDIARVVRALPGKVEKVPAEEYFKFTTRMGGLFLSVFTQREKVCRKVVTGTRVVTSREVDYSKVPDDAYHDVTHETEIVEWVCDQPLLSVV